MTARFASPLYPGGRMCLLSGSVTVGAIFPPPDGKGDWHWRMWAAYERHRGYGTAKSEQAAKNALLAHWRDFLAAAQLQEIPTTRAGGSTDG